MSVDLRPCVAGVADGPPATIPFPAPHEPGLLESLAETFVIDGRVLVMVGERWQLEDVAPGNPRVIRPSCLASDEGWSFRVEDPATKRNYYPANVARELAGLSRLQQAWR